MVCLRSPRFFPGPSGTSGVETQASQVEALFPKEAALLFGCRPTRVNSLSTLSAVMSNNRHLEALRKKLAKVAPAGKLEFLARDQPVELITEAALESIGDSAGRGETLDRLVARSVGRSAESEASALCKLANGDFDDVTPEEQLQLEAIVEEEGRQVSFILDDIFEDLPAPWIHFNDPAGPIRQKILDAIPLIGRVEIAPSSSGGAPQHLGTGFIVGPDLMMTNRHVAALFVRGLGLSQLSFVPGLTTAIDFKRERGFTASDNSANVRIGPPVMVHPYWDMALFRVANLPSGTVGLSLSVSSPDDLRDREIAVIGYPGRSRDRSPKAVELEQKYFGNIFGVKRLAPGEIRERERMKSFDHQVSAMTHDSSTLPGNSGAAVLDVETGDIVGLHFAGITLKANYSVPTFELARDRRVVDVGLNFRGNVGATDEWENFWKVAEPENESGGALPSTG
jgi:endonuclease G, mitochondrial